MAHKRTDTDYSHGKQQQVMLRLHCQHGKRKPKHDNKHVIQHSCANLILIAFSEEMDSSYYGKDNQQAEKCNLTSCQYVIVSRICHPSQLFKMLHQRGQTAFPNEIRCKQPIGQKQTYDGRQKRAERQRLHLECHEQPKDGHEIKYTDMQQTQ